MSVSRTTFSYRPALVTLATLTSLGLVAFGGMSGAFAAEPGETDFLGSAETYVIVAQSSISDVSTPSEVHGDVALTGTSNDVTPGTNDEVHVADPTATTVLGDVNAAYLAVAAAQPGTVVVGTVDLSLQTTPYTPGTYNSGSSLLVGDDITLDGLTDQNAVFIFQAGSSLTVANGAKIILINGAQACNVYWQVTSDATIGVGANFVGTILAGTSITVNTDATVDGRLLSSALNAGSVTLDHNVINGQSKCVRTSTSGGDSTTTTTENGGTIAATTSSNGTVTTITTLPDGTTTTAVVPPVVTTPVDTTPVVDNTVVVDRLQNTGSARIDRLANTGSSADLSLTLLLAALGLALGGSGLLVWRRTRTA